MRRYLILLLLGVAALAMYWTHVDHARQETAPPFRPQAPSQAERNQESAAVRLSAAVAGDRVRLAWDGQGRGEAVLYRSTTDLGAYWVDPARFPVAVRRVQDRGTAVDAEAPHGVPLYYQMKLDGRFTNVASVTLPARRLGTLSAPAIRVDKLSCTLTVYERGEVVKRYPIALGRNPFRRKLHQDNASTPEGVYRIIGLQPEATYYRAYDISYPNATDRFRYDFAAERGLLPRVDGKTPGIGGEIQIHGKGIRTHWTHGCIALRNEDMDELFACRAIAEGTPVLIWGTELSRRDVEGLYAGTVPATDAGLRTLGYKPARTMRSLAELQLKEKLPVTGVLDERTRARLGQ